MKIVHENVRAELRSNGSSSLSLDYPPQSFWGELWDAQLIVEVYHEVGCRIQSRLSRSNLWSRNSTTPPHSLSTCHHSYAGKTIQNATLLIAIINGLIEATNGM